MEASAGSAGGKGPRGTLRVPIHSIGADMLCIVFSRLDPSVLVRCASVCKFWNDIIYSSTLMSDLYYKVRLHCESSSMLSAPIEMKRYFEDLALEQHRLSLLGSSTEVHQWRAHSSRISLCCLRRGLILTDAEDKVMRLWSAESCKCLKEYCNLNKDPLVDYDFDENKIVGLTGSQMCIWTLKTGKSLFQSREGIFTRGICMRYIDPEAVIGCDDGRARIFDMYSGKCTRIIRMHSGAVSCLALTEDQLVLGGSNFGSVTVADLSTGVQSASLKSLSHAGMKSLYSSIHSHLVFAGSTAGYVHCWDLRTSRLLWETRVSPNVVYGVHHLPSDASTLAVGGLDGVLRILSQNTGKILSNLIMSTSRAKLDGSTSSGSGSRVKRKAEAVSADTEIHNIPRCQRPPITCLGVGWQKIVTAHNEKYLSLWRFNQSLDHV
ncbi:F-box/WD-40 repeat-containing protein [Platanthera guangdongensis]|uniref:F-box/WD-40 repeat-containing protein n=1 Tax=Platanthera guangdongensis TaxID=2320717 RepID=A0ABR2M3S6_9ASPA